MHVNGRRARSSGALVLVALVVLLAVVAIASSGHVPAGSSTTRGPARELADTLLSLLLVLMLIGGVGIICLYYLRRTNLHEERRRGRQRRRPRAYLTAITIAALLVLIVFRVSVHNHNGLHPVGLVGATAAAGSNRGGGSAYTPRFAPVPVAVVLGLAALAALAGYLALRARRRALRPHPLEPSLALTLADVLGETLDDLRAEPDPRVAVIAAYARLERTLAAFGLPRRESDAPLEYLRRLLVDLEAGSSHVSRLTELFEDAKFSNREIGPGLKEEAITLLESMRSDLQAAEARAAATAPPERAQGQPA